MDKESYFSEIKNLLEQNLDNSEIISNNIIQYNCVLCGRSKNNKPHMRVVYDEGFFYCYRCNDGGILYNLIKQFKNNNNSEYIDNILKLYFNFYEYNSSEKKIKSTTLYSSYEFTLNNLLSKVNTSTLTDIQLNFLKTRFPTLSNNQLLDTVNKFNINTTRENRLFYNSLYRKFAYCYSINDDLSYKKEKFTNKNVSNDRKDYYYLINSYSAKNLYISEGLFDLITLDIVNPLYNSNESNYLALCCRNYNFLYDVLLNSGKFFYDNIYIVLDNDINEKRFINNTIQTLYNKGKYEKFKLFKNVYTISVPYQYIDINDYYLHDNNLSEILINKVK